MPSIYDAIKQDHAKHRELMATIADTSGDSAARHEAWSAFFYEIKAHAAAEEETFYSQLMSETWGQDSARHSVTEHEAMDELLEELNDKDFSSPGWLERFKKLRHDYEHHMEEEENEVFGRAKQVIGAEHNEAFGDRFLARKTQEYELVDRKEDDHLED